MRNIVLTSVALALLASAYVFGAWSFAHELWPIDALRSVKRTALGEKPLEAGLDSFGRLVSIAGRQEIACPQQTPRTAVVLFIGQSIQSNSAGQKSVSEFGPRVAAWFDGHCTIAQSPLPGATGRLGEVMTPFANRLLALGRFDNVVLVPAAIGGTRIARWAAGGDLNALLAGVLDRLAAQYQVTQVIWHQGEDDFAGGTSEATYRAQFATLLQTLRAHGVAAPVYVSVTSRCDDDNGWAPDNPVTRALRSLPDPAKGLFPGVDTDALLQPVDRYDGCHLGASGVARYADALAGLFPQGDGDGQKH